MAVKLQRWDVGAEGSWRDDNGDWCASSDVEELEAMVYPVWTALSEERPPHDCPVLICTNYRRCHVATRMNGFHRWCIVGNVSQIDPENITHWAHLPVLPKR